MYIKMKGKTPVLSSEQQKKVEARDAKKYRGEEEE
jgi:hypothetical protein